MTAIARCDSMFTDPTPDLTGVSGTGWAGIIGGLILAITTGFLGLRKYLSNESVTTAANAAQTELINLLREQIKQERDRADAAEASRDKALTEIQDLKDQIFNLTQEVKSLRAQVGGTPVSPK